LLTGLAGKKQCAALDGAIVYEMLAGAYGDGIQWSRETNPLTARRKNVRSCDSWGETENQRHQAELLDQLLIQSGGQNLLHDASYPL
jgi:hypothetical protein